MPKSTDVAGNTLASQALLDREINKTGLVIYQVARLFDARQGDEIVLTHIRINGPGSGRADFMAVVKGVIDGVEVVGFHSSDSLPDVIRGTLNRIMNGTLKWKEDQPYAN